MLLDEVPLVVVVVLATLISMVLAVEDVDEEVLTDLVEDSNEV